MSIPSLPAKTAPKRLTQKYPPKAINTAWKARLIKTGGQHPRPLGNVANAIIAFEHAPEWRGVLGFNESALTTTAIAAVPWVDLRTPPFPWTDADDIRCAAWLQHRDISVGKEIAGQAIQSVSRGHPFHPIRDYLQSLEWDGIKRIGTWLSTYLGAEPTSYTLAVGRRWLIGGVARVLQPGCKNDCCLILEGLQGTLKSTSVKALADPWFTDELADLGSKDAALQLRGAWIIEMPELDAMQATEASRIKAFMSRSHDRYRPPYGRRVIEVPRECIFAGTVNHETYFKDETGARRFWPVKTGPINIAELKRDRDQLWAEAHAAYLSGAPWWLDKNWMVVTAAKEQSARYQDDPWDTKIATYIESRESVSISEVLERCVKKPKEQWTQPDQNRVARSLRALGWQRFRPRDGAKREWRYRNAS